MVLLWRIIRLRKTTFQPSIAPKELLTDSCHPSWRKFGLLDASAPPVGGQDGLAVAEGAIGVAAGQLSHRVSHDPIRLQTQLGKQVDLSDLKTQEKMWG